MVKFYEIYSNDIIKRINKFIIIIGGILTLIILCSFGIGIIIEFNGCFRRVKNVLYLDLLYYIFFRLIQNMIYLLKKFIISN